ncbi:MULTISPECIES: alpha/beta hydrolase [Roseobacteraceae]|uniref:Hydrolase or acyltransferase of alpha/beta superfamily protein n=1 Tax=Celeribacter baekdonensis B30 TaxID=1208323 RepID=K2IYA8_9RHOB|nr:MULTISPECIES: alpha/beta hydrolase [Roseobacteraceae]EKE67582.1 hydrolase or acyltransferase of alpha/beta superfamily protein [Celeribacter baekdonensis B30]TMV89797.1 alpha/beta hydrolase [Thioclava sp. BHET1]
MPKRTFVLVPGAWFGGWVWRDLAERLRMQGCIVTTPTLTGLGERCHTNSNSADLTLHIEDVVSHIQMEGLDNVDLLGWSYGGMVISGVHSRIPEKIRSLIFFDAFMPDNGMSLVDMIDIDKRELYDTARGADQKIPPISMKAFGVNDPTVLEFVEPRTCLQPWRTFFEPVSVSPDIGLVSQSYILCTKWGIVSPMTRFLPLALTRKANVIKVKGSHLAMLTEPDETLAAVLSTP